MKVTVRKIVTIELMKFFKRADMIVVLGLIVISFFYAVNMEQSVGGQENQSALYWVTNQMMLITALFIGPVIMSYIGSQFLAVEIDNGSIMLFEEKIRNRRRLYLGKNIAMTIICTMLFLLCAGIMIGFYFLLIDRNIVFVSGKFFGANAREQITLLLYIYTYTFFFVPQMSFFLGTIFKPLSVIVISTGIVLLCNYVFNFSPLKYMNPFWGIMCLTDRVFGSAAEVTSGSVNLLQYDALQIGVVSGYYGVFLYAGAKVFARKDIQ